MITKLRLKKFKRFKRKGVPLRESGITLLAGGNNSGKSSILHGLAVWEFCRTVIEAEKARSAFLPESKAQGLGLSGDEFSPINLPSLRHLWTNLSPQKTQDDEDGYTLRVRCDWSKERRSKYLEFGLALANDRLFVKTTSTNLHNDDYIPRVAYLPPFAGMTDREARVPGAIRRRKIGEGLAGSVLRNILVDLHQENLKARDKVRGDKHKLSDKQLKILRDSDPWELLQQAIRETFGAELIVAPFFEEYHSYLRVDVVKGSLQGHKLRRYEKYKPRDLMVEGAGFLQWLGVYALACDPRIDVLLLDEPDAHLHCSLQAALFKKLEDLSTKTRKQVLIATHSSEILRNAEPNKILRVDKSNGPRFLRLESQKVSLLAGLGTTYAPKIDAIKRCERVFFVENESDFRVLTKFAERLDRTIGDGWVVWPSATTHRDRKHIFIALKEEIPELVGLSLRDRDDEALGTVGDNLGDLVLDAGPVDYYCKKWRRRHIENYLLLPEAIAASRGTRVERVEEQFRDRYGLAVGRNFPDANAPRALSECSGKEILQHFGANAERVAEAMRPEMVPEDIITILDVLERLHGR